jgi:hypothetical protein
VKKLIALIIGVALVSGMAGLAAAQGSSSMPAKEEKKTDKPVEAKKAAVQSASGTVRTTGADSLVVSGKAKGGKDAEWTFAVDAKTKVRKAGKNISAVDLAAGDAVLVRYHDQEGKHVADSVMVRAAKKPAAGTGKAETSKQDETKK